MHADGVNFAVLDVETTGLIPADCRTIEIAIVEIDRRGRRLDQFSSLLQIPGDGPLGAEFIHHITREMLNGAPEFSEVIGAIRAHLEGRIIVGHVVEFDLGHLQEEFRRAGVEMPRLSGSALCTRDLARMVLPPGPKTLGACCELLGIGNEAAHTALGDARAAADLLIRMLQMENPVDLDALGQGAALVEWPEVAHVAQRSAKPRELLDLDL